MTPADATKLLDLPAGATRDHVQARVQEIVRKLDEKIARAPTPGLQARYREALAETEAAATLLLGAAEHVVSPTLASPAEKPVANSAKPRQCLKWAIRVVAVTAIVVAAGFTWLLRQESVEAEKSVRRMAGDNVDSPEPAENVVKPVDASDPAKKIAELKAILEAEEKEIAKAADEYEARAKKLLQEYQSSPHKPALWRAETWTEAQQLMNVVGMLRESPVKEWSVMKELDAFGKVKDGPTLAEIEERVSQVPGTVNRLWMHLWRKSSLEITSDPSGLTWTVTSNYDKDKLLVVSGTTPVKDERFVGWGDGELRISCPGFPDYVEKVSLGISPWSGGVFAEAKFKR